MISRDFCNWCWCLGSEKEALSRLVREGLGGAIINTSLIAVGPVRRYH
jgi:hypothetical protein